MKFSIIICCFNSQEYISDTISSVLNQNFKNFEVIIIDDGSTDNTKNIIESFVKKYANIKYYYQTNKGFASARNLAIEKSSSQWIVIIDHDDLCMPDRLLIHNQQLESNKTAKLFFGNTIHFDDEGERRKFFDIFETKNFNLKKNEVSNSLIKIGCFIDTESVMFDKEAAKKIGGFDTSYKYLADYDFFCRMGDKYEFDFTLNILSKWRIHEKQSTNIMQNIYKKELIKFYFLRLFTHKGIAIKLLLFLLIIKNIVKLLLVK